MHHKGQLDVHIIFAPLTLYPKILLSRIQHVTGF